MTALWHDIRYGIRQLHKSPCFTTIAVLSLALGIGANTAIFSMINGILLKSLPVRNPEELRLINWTCQQKPMRDIQGNFGYSKLHGYYCGSFPYSVYRQFIEEVQGLSDFFAFSYTGDTMTIRSGNQASLAYGQKVSGNFFKNYGARVLIGRPITPEDDRPDAAPVAVLTYSFWKRVYGMDPHVLGQTLVTKNTSYTVIGVLPRQYVGPHAGESRTDFYVPLAIEARSTGEENRLTSDTVWWIQIMGRVAPGIDEAHIKASLEILFSNILNHSDVEIDRPGIFLQDGRHGVMIRRREIASPLWFLQGVAGLILLIACINLAGLLLARGAARRHEMAIRAAIGAGRWRLLRQSLTESLILSLVGVCLGLIFSTWIRAALKGLIVNPSAPQLFKLNMDTRVLMFTLAVGVVTTLLSGLFPALHAGNTNPSAGLKDSGGRGSPRLRLGRILVVAQVGLSVLLVVFAGLLSRTLINLYRADPGFDTENILLVRIKPYKSLSRVGERTAYYHTLRQKISEIPGVRSVCLSHLVLLDGAWSRPFSIPNRPDTEQYESQMLIVSDGFFTTMGISLLAGRDFRATDVLDSQRVVIVNAAFGRKFFPEENPLGRYITFADQQWQIVGLCSNHKYAGLRWNASPILYFHQTQFRATSVTYAIRSVLPPLSMVPAVRKAVAEVDRNLPLEDITTQKLVLKESIALERLYASLCVSLTLLAVLLSCIGLYGIMAYNVARRTNEMGIRKALGACPWDVAWPIMRGALILTVIGVAIGLPFALALVRVIQFVIYGIEPYDPLTMIGAVVIMVVVAAMAALIPARRAARIDPMEALRYE